MLCKRPKKSGGEGGELRRLLGSNVGEGCLALRLLQRGPCDPPLFSNREALISDDASVQYGLPPRLFQLQILIQLM